MAAGKLTPFYIGLGVVAVGGAVWIASSMKGPGMPALDTSARPPVSAGPRGVVFGSDSAPVELLELSDFECPWCARYAILQMPDIKQRLVPGGRVRVRFIHYPLAMHRKGPMAHLAAACANEQGRFWQMHDLIFENQQEWVAGNTARFMRQYAERAGLDLSRYDSCVDEQRAWGQVLADKALGDSIAPGAGTPTFFLNGRLLSDAPSYDQLRRLVDSLAPVAAAVAPATR